MNSTKRGFTLIELLVVIAIIGILSSIVLASLNTARVKSRDARRVADIKQLQLALQLFYDANSSYPTTTANFANLAPTYIATIPKDPVGQTAYFYDPQPTACVGTASCASYHLAATLEDSTNQALNSDVDLAGDSGSIDTSADATGCIASVTTRYCYDVTP